STLLFAARPTISSRSGMSWATFNVLSPIDPVAPNTTTRLRFISIRLALRHPNHKAQIKKQERRGEEEAVDQIERSADPRQEIPGILDPGAAFEDRLGQVANHRRKAEQQTKQRGMCPIQDRQVSRHQFEKHQTAK